MSEKLQEIRIKQHLITYARLIAAEQEMLMAGIRKGKMFRAVQLEQMLIRGRLIGLGVSSAELTKLVASGEGK